MNKEVIRQVFLDKRLTLTSEEWDRRCEIITNVFFDNISLERIRMVHVYLPMTERKEPDVWRVINRLQREWPKLKICISKTVWEDYSLLHYLYEGNDQLLENKMGIPEPQFGTLVQDSEIDLVLVPLISFDRSGNRIGYGGGFYDRFLEKLPASSNKVGFTISTPLDAIEDIEEFDIPLDSCVCPTGFYEFSKS